MRTTIVIQQDLIEEAMRLTGAKTMKHVVHQALQELIRQARLKRLVARAGTMTMPLTRGKLIREREDA